MNAVELSARPYVAADRESWDDLVRRSRHGHFLLERGYLEYHADRYPDASLLFEDEGRLVAALPLSRAGDEVTSHGGVTFGGVIGDDRMSTGLMLRVFDAALARLRADGVERLVYKPVPAVYHRIPADEDLYALFRSGARLVRRDISAAIRLDERLPYAKGRRSAVKKANALGLVVARDDDWAGFMAVEAAVLAARHGVRPVHTAAELALLAGRFPDGIQLWTARREGELLGGVVVYATAVCAHAQYIGATPEGMAIGALDAVLDHLLGTAYADRRWWDFGISTEDDGQVLNEGLARNKESWGGRGMCYDRYAVDLL